METDHEISTRISERFDVLRLLTQGSIDGKAKSLIVTGPPGLGKSHQVETMFQVHDPKGHNHMIVKGFIRATGLYKLLYDHKEVGQTIIFDDADSVFFDETCLSLLKAVCDTTDIRTVSWRTEGRLLSEDGTTQLPKCFDFNGTIIFISNIDFDAKIEKGDKLAPHLEALISRSHFIDLGMKNRREYMIRIKQVLSQGLLDKKGLDEIGKEEVIAFIEENSSNFRELSLRTALKIADLYKPASDHWRKVAKITLCKNK